MAAARSLPVLAAVLRQRQEQVRQLQEHNYLWRVRRGLSVLHLRILEEMAAHKVMFGCADAAELQQQVEALRQDAGCTGFSDEPSALAVFEPLRDYLEWLQPGHSMLGLERWGWTCLNGGRRRRSLARHGSGKQLRHSQLTRPPLFISPPRPTCHSRICAAAAPPKGRWTGISRWNIPKQPPTLSLC